jgi:trigger factor
MGLFGSAEKLKIKKIKHENCEALFSVEIPAPEARAEEENSLVRYQERAVLSGFRAGKAPLDLIKKQFSEAIRQDAVTRLARKHVPEALTELKLHPVAPPVIQAVDYAPGKSMRLSVLVETQPEIDPKGYTKIALKRRAAEPGEKAVEERLNELREANARLEPAPEEAVGKDHYVVIDYSGLQGAKPLAAKSEAELVDMSSKQILEGLAEGLLGMKRGEAKEIPVAVKGKPSKLQVVVKEIKRKVLPTLDAEFAKDMGFETLDELKLKLKELVSQEADKQAERDVHEQIEDALLKANRIPLPPSLIESELRHRLERVRARLLGPRGQWPDAELRSWTDKLRPLVEKDLKISYLLAAIARKEKLQVPDEDLAKELDRSLESADTEEKKEGIRKAFGGRRDEIRAILLDRKTMSFIKGQAASS